MHPSNPRETLRTVIGRSGAVVVAGTGVSMSASRDASTGKPHPQASWAGLLENGLEWLKQHNHMAGDEAAAHLTLLKKRGDTHHFVSAAEDITRLMGGAASTYYESGLARPLAQSKRITAIFLMPWRRCEQAGICWQRPTTTVCCWMFPERLNQSHGKNLMCSCAPPATEKRTRSFSYMVTGDNQPL